VKRRATIAISARVEIEEEDRTLWVWILPMGRGCGVLRCIRIDKPIEPGMHYGTSHHVMIDNEILRLFPDEPIPELWRLFDANTC